jgi:hypothetical protein
MLTKLRLLSTAGTLIALTSAGALAQTINPAGTYMGPPLKTEAAPVVTAQATVNTMPNYYSPYGAASPVINNAAPEGSGTNPYQSGVGTSGHAPLR